MTHHDEFIGQVETYLDEREGSTPLPEAVRDAIRAELPSTHQRPAWWPARRFPEMSNMAKLAFAAAAVVVAALLGFNYFLASNVGGLGDPTPTPSPTSVARLDDREPFDAGRYIAASGPEFGVPFDVTVEVPAGWSGDGNWVAIGPGGNDEPDGMAIRFYAIDNLAANPLSYDDGVIDPSLGPSVDDLVQAVLSHPGWETTAPTDITLDGYEGQRIQLTIPADADIGEPPNDRYFLSLDPGNGGIYGWSPGQTFDWYIVDVDGERYVIDAFHYPGTSEEDRAAQRAVVESAQFVPKP